MDPPVARTASRSRSPHTTFVAAANACTAAAIAAGLASAGAAAAARAAAAAAAEAHAAAAVMATLADDRHMRPQIRSGRRLPEPVAKKRARSAD